MKKIIIVSVLLIIHFSPLYSKILFQDTFANFNNISKKSNIRITNSNNCVISNIPADDIFGYCNTKVITRASNEKWDTLTVSYKITNHTGIQPNFPKIYLKILDIYNDQIYSLPSPLEQASSTNSVIDLNAINQLSSYGRIKLYFKLVPGEWTSLSTRRSTPLLKGYQVSVEEIQQALFPPKNQGFYGVPSPLEIGDETSIRFFYHFENNTSVTIKIYDTNYNLVKIICTDKKYNAGTNLDAEWNAKNGNNADVISGVYIAIMEIKDNKETSSHNFQFAVIR